MDKELIKGILEESFKKVCKDIVLNETLGENMNEKTLFDKYIKYFTEEKDSQEKELSETGLVREILKLTSRQLIKDISIGEELDEHMLLEEYHQECYYGVEMVKAVSKERGQLTVKAKKYKESVIS